MTHTFNISIDNNTPSNNKFNNTSYIDSLILSNIKKNFSNIYKKENDDKDIIYTFDSTPKRAPRTRIINIDITHKKSNKPNIDYKTFYKAFNAILSTNNFDTYDFKLDDGTPIKIFSDEIQIGYELLPINDATLYLYNTLSNNRKKNIIDIYIDIKK